VDLDHAIDLLRRSCDDLEKALKSTRPELLAEAEPKGPAPATRVGVRQPEPVR
jgi:hypothetical protein